MVECCYIIVSMVASGYEQWYIGLLLGNYKILQWFFGVIHGYYMNSGVTKYNIVNGLLREMEQSMVNNSMV